MDEFCPLCRKNGCNNKIKPVQLNFHEAVYLCESETCHWPYGYEEFKFIPRSIDEIGKISPRKSNIKSEVQKTKDGTNVIPISTELSMYTPPVTPSNDSSSSKEIVKGTTSILHDIFNSTTNNDHNNDVSHSGKFMKPPSGDSYASINNSTSKIANASSITAVKNENMPPKVPSIFDIDSSVVLSTNNLEKSQIDKLIHCDIRNFDGKITQLLTLSNECNGIQSSTLLPGSISQTQNVEVADVRIKKIKSEKEFKSIVRRKSQATLTPISTSDQVDTKLNKKVVIFKEKLPSGIIISEDKVTNQIINRKRPSSDDKNLLNVMEQSPKKISRVIDNQKLHNRSINAFCKVTNELLENCTPIIESNRHTSSDETTKSHIVNSPEDNLFGVSSVQSKESMIVDNSLDTSNIDDSLNLDTFIEENLNENCPNNTLQIDDDWIQSLLVESTSYIGEQNESL